MIRDLLLPLSIFLALTGSAGAAARRTAIAPASKRAVTTKPKFTARVTSQTPLAVGLAIDQSQSNEDAIAHSEVPATKAQAIARAVNTNLEAMVAASMHGVDEVTNEPTFKPWFHVAGVGYSSDVRPLFRDRHGFISTAELARSAEWTDQHGHPAYRPEDYVQMKWVEPEAWGATAMGDGLAALVPHFERFVKDHPDAPAPIVMHFSDGQPYGETMDHLQMATRLKRLRTKDGGLVLFNVHVGEHGDPFVFPTQKTIDALPHSVREDALRLFRMSSPLPPTMLARARAMFPEHRIKDGARAMVYNAGDGLLAQLLELGTVQNMKARK